MGFEARPPSGRLVFASDVQATAVLPAAADDIPLPVMIYRMKYIVFFHNDQTGTPLNDKRSISDFSLGDEPLPGLYVLICHFVKNGTSIIFGNEFQKLGMKICRPFFYLDLFIKIAV